jgi:hypothetical protein
MTARSSSCETTSKRRQRYGITNPELALGPEPGGTTEQRQARRTVRHAIERRQFKQWPLRGQRSRRNL